MANKTTANFIGVSDAYSGTSGAWSITEARERILSSVHGENWGRVAFNVDFLVIGGGGGSGRSSYVAHGGGGAGGYLNSFGSESSGANSAGLAGKNVFANEDFTVTVGAGGAVGANGSNSVFSGTDKSRNIFTLTAIGGGRGGDAQDAGDGGSGGGAGNDWQRTATTATSSDSGNGTANQGSDGGDVSGVITPANANVCNIFGTANFCDNGNSTLAGGGGGGAGGAASSSTGGAGLASSITGTSVTRAGGGAGLINGTAGTNGTGQDQAGGGGANSAGNNGTVILRYPNTFTISFSASDLTGSTATDGSDKVTTFTAGSGTVSWSLS